MNESEGLIDLSKPIRKEKVKWFQPPWRIMFIYHCPSGHEVRIYANSYKGKKAVPGIGKIVCPQCEIDGPKNT